ncbi:MAG: PQQ-binding-like beta-propeller repeat protein [Pseudomonadota bacterium]
MLKKIFICSALVSFFISPATSPAQIGNTPWPKFHHDIKNTGKTENFGTTVGKLKWKFVTGAAVTSSPIIDNSRTVYFGSADNYFYAIDAETGSIKWSYLTGGAIELASPAIDINDIVYIGSNDGYMYAFDTKTIDTKDKTTWKEKWKYKTGGAISSSAAININGNILFASNDGYLYSLTAGGTLGWKQYVGASWCSPAIDTHGQVYIGVWEPQDSLISMIPYEVPDTDPVQIINAPAKVNFFALDATTGAFVWDFPGQPSKFCVPGGVLASPVVRPDGYIIASYFITWANTGCDEKLWKYNVFRLNWAGTYDNWRFNIDSDADIYSTPAVIEDNSIFVASSNKVTRILPDTTLYLFETGDGQRIESSPAVDGKKNIFFGSNGGRFYSICADCPETPLLWQYPRKEDDALASQDGITTASIISSPAIDNDNRHSIYVGASDGNVYAFFDGARIAGKVVLDSDSSPLQAVKITLQSTFTDVVKETYTDPNGEYFFVGVENFTYTVTPEKLGYVFTPQQRTAVIKQDQDALNMNFTAFDGFTITGKILDAGSKGVADVVVTIEGATTKISSTTTTNSSGVFSFTGLGYDTYTITPELAGYSFDPSSQKKTITSSTAGNEKIFEIGDFNVFQGYQISGMVMDVRKLENEINGIAGLTINLAGTTADKKPVNLYKTTDSEGKYSFTGLSNGTYTVTPGGASGYPFEPTLQNVTIASANMLNINFYAGTGFAISGSIKWAPGDNATFSNCTVDLYNDNATTLFKVAEQIPINSVKPDSQGNFVFIGVAAGAYIVKPSLNGYGFDPVLYKTIVTTTPVTSLLFTAIQGYYISGKVTNLVGISEVGITIQLIPSTFDQTATPITAITSKDGVYAFTGLEPGDFTISLGDADKKQYQLYPASINVAITSESKDNINFIANSSCTVSMFNFPFFGNEGTLVNIFGTNFGWSKPPDNETVAIAIDSPSPQGASLTKTSGVYFGTDDPTTWVKAKVKMWSPIKILAEAPQPAVTGFGITKVWVVRKTASDSGCGKALSSNFFFYVY